MKRILLTALCTTLVVAMTVPALADHRIGGYFRDRFIMADLSFTKDGNDNPDKLVDQRMRMRWQNNINEYISVVWYGEVDFQWGDAAFSTGRNNGGAVGGDTVNLETKNAMAMLKIPDTPVSVKLGLQNFNAGENLVLDDDAAGVQIGAKMDMVDLNLQYAKFYGSDGGIGSFTSETDVDFWGVEVGLMPMPGLKVGVNGYWKNDNQNDADLYWVVLNGGYKLEMVDLDAAFGYNFGDDGKNGAGDTIDVSGYYAHLHGTFSVAGAQAGFRLIYMSGDNDEKDANYYHGALPNMGGRFSYGIFDGLMIFDSDITTNSYTGDQYAFNDAGFTDHGMWGATAMAKYSPPAMKQMYGQVAVGYFSAVEDKTKRIAETQGTSLGTEFAVRVGYKIAERFDLSLNGAYAILGDFYDKSDNGEDPDNPYKLYAMVNIPY